MEQERAPGVRRTPRPNMTDQNIKSRFIWVKFDTREFTKSMITNLNLDPNSEIQNDRKKCSFWLYCYFITNNFKLNFKFEFK